MLSLLLAAGLALQAESALDAGRRALEAGDYNRAEQLFRRHIAAHPDSAEAYSNQAIIFSRREQYAEAVRLYETALKFNPKLIPIHFNLAVALGKEQRFADAAAHLRIFLKGYPNEARAHQLLGLCLVETGDLQAAITELETSYKQNPADGSIVFALAYTNARAGKPERAAELLTSLESKPVQAKLIQGLLEYRRQRFAEAKSLFRDVVREMPDVAPAVAALGRLELRDRNDQEAIRLLERAIQLNRGDAESTYQLGVLYDRNGRKDEAVAMLTRALTLRANYADPRYHLARIAFDRGDYRTAAAELEKARRILPEQESIRFLLGRTYQALGREEEARVEFAHVKKLKAQALDRARERLESEELLKP